MPKNTTEKTQDKATEHTIPPPAVPPVESPPETPPTAPETPAAPEALTPGSAQAEFAQSFRSVGERNVVVITALDKALRIAKSIQQPAVPDGLIWTPSGVDLAPHLYALATHDVPRMVATIKGKLPMLDSELQYIESKVMQLFSIDNWLKSQNAKAGKPIVGLPQPFYALMAVHVPVLIRALRSKCEIGDDTNRVANPGELADAMVNRAKEMASDPVGTVKNLFNRHNKPNKPKGK